MTNAFEVRVPNVPINIFHGVFPKRTTQKKNLTERLQRRISERKKCLSLSQHTAHTSQCTHTAQQNHRRTSGHLPWTTSPHLPLHFCQRWRPPQTDIFFFGEREGFQSQPHFHPVPKSAVFLPNDRILRKFHTCCRTHNRRPSCKCRH